MEKDSLTGIYPIFTGGGKGKLVKYPFKRTIETMITVMGRRNKTLIKKDVDTLKKLYLKSK